MKKILYIVPHRFNRSPGQRFRCEHFIPWLRQHNFHITYANLLTEWDDRHFYKPGNYLIKAFILMKSYLRRVGQLRNVAKYDAVFIYREAFMLGTIRFEKRIRRKGVPIIYDFDDAIWLNDVSAANKELKWLKRPSKTGDICSLSSLVIVGNEYLATYARQYADNVAVVPTTIDTNYHLPANASKTSGNVRIGWTGSSTTLKHFRLLLPLLKRLKSEYGEKLRVRLIADEPIIDNELEIENVRWSAEDEIQQLDEIDIGIMPLPDDEWARGKCGFKGLQYMSMGIPAVMSPVGVNKEIIRHGENGFLAESDAQWEQILKTLIDDAQLRQKLGQVGRQTIIDKYSILANRERYLQLFRNVM
ncbi:MAG: glycosyltransferase family 4 protein [Salinivirgaceae bacterium]